MNSRARVKQRLTEVVVIEHFEIASGSGEIFNAVFDLDSRLTFEKAIGRPESPLVEMKTDFIDAAADLQNAWAG